MRSSASSIRKIVSPLLKHTLTCLILLSVSACVRNPNTIPDGYGAIFKDDARSSQAARIDYPIVMNVDPNATNITFRVTRKGERFWFWNHLFWDRPFLKRVNWYRIALLDQGVPDPICITDWAKPGENDEVEVPCQLLVKDHTSRPLVALLDFWATDDHDHPPGANDPTIGIVDRVVYLIPKQ